MGIYQIDKIRFGKLFNVIILPQTPTQFH